MSGIEKSRSNDLHIVEASLAALLKEARPYERYWCEQLESAKPVPFSKRFFRPTENKSPLSLPTKNLHSIDHETLAKILADANLKISSIDALFLLVVNLFHRISNFSQSHYWVKLNVPELEKRLRGNFESLSASTIYSFAKPDPKHDDIVKTLRRLSFDLQEQRLQFTFRRDVVTRCKLNLSSEFGEFLTTPSITISEFTEIFPGNIWQYLMHFQNGLTLGIGKPDSEVEGLKIATMVNLTDPTLDPIELELIGADVADLIKSIADDPEEGINGRSYQFVPSAQLSFLEKVIRNFEYIENDFIMETDRTGITTTEPGTGVNVMAIIKPEIKSQILKFPSFPEFETWEETFDKIYEDLNDDELYVGWNDYCSEKVKPIPTVQMDEWLKHTLDSIKNLKPEIVLEIGVGSGVILEKIAPLCDQYVGTDISSKSVQFLNEFVQRKKWCDTVSVKKREASVFAPEEKEYYDTIILNSVIQYFSNVDHLMSVMEGVLAATKPGGRIFIGDVRNRALARNRQADIEAATLHVECPVSAFQENIKYGVDGDKEICINPEFFKLFAQNHPDKVDHVVIQSRRAKYHNEMSRYRYDAIIYLKNPEAPYEKKEAHGVNWSVISTPDIEKMLATSDYGHYLVKEIPNARISRSLLALNMNLNKPKTIFQEEFKKVKKEFKDTATDPEDLVLLGERFGYKSRIVPSTKDVNCFDILYFRKEGIHSHYFEDEPLEGQPVYEDFINNPVENLNMQQIYGEFIIHLNRFIEEHYIQMPHINFVKDLTSREIVF